MGATCQRMVCASQFCIAIMLLPSGRRNHLHTSLQPIVREEVTEVVGTCHHHQVVVVERPTWKVDIPLAIFLVIELQVILVAASTCIVILSFILYTIGNVRLIRSGKKEAENGETDQD